MLEAVKENLCINRSVGSKAFKVAVEGDLIIPDVKPDILNSINLTGNVCIYKKEILEGKIRLDGNVNMYIMYLADSEDKPVRGFSGEIDFTEILDFPGIDSKMLLEEDIQIKQIDCKVLNGRKVNIKVMLEVKTDIFLNEKEAIIKEINNIEDIQSQRKNLSINSLVGQNLTKAQAKETLIIDNMDNLLEILSLDFDIKNKEAKVSYNKVLAKADVEARILYLTQERRNKEIRRNNSSHGIY